MRPKKNIQKRVKRFSYLTSRFFSDSVLCFPLSNLKFSKNQENFYFTEFFYLVTLFQPTVVFHTETSHLISVQIK